VEREVELPEQDVDRLFLHLVMVFEAQAVVQLGKVVDPTSGETRRDLDGAKTTIAIIEMLERKTKGNLSDREAEAVRHVLTGLRMNYVDELRKDATPSAEDAAGDEGVPQGSPPAEQEGTDAKRAAAQDAADAEESAGAEEVDNAAS
jgi:hypothetical protein